MEGERFLRRDGVRERGEGGKERWEGAKERD